MPKIVTIAIANAQQIISAIFCFVRNGLNHLTNVSILSFTATPLP